MNLKSLCLAALFPMVILLAGCQQDTTPTTPTDVDLQAEAARLAQEILIIDTHIDLPYRLKEKMDDVSVRTEDGHFDYVRAVQGGVNYESPSVSAARPRGRSKRSRIVQ